MIEEELLSITEHALQIFRLLGALLDYDDRHCTTDDGEILNWMSAADWLYSSCCVTSVDVDPDPDNSTMMCSGAWQYAEARGRILKGVMKELTIFSFLWGSFETVAKVTNPDEFRTGKFGLVRACYRYLSQRHDRFPAPRAYFDTIAALRDRVEQVPDLRGIAREFALKPDMTFAGVGIYVVSRLRNKFAHGTIALPTPSAWGDDLRGGGVDDGSFADAMRASSRIVLFTIQMMLFCLYRDATFEVQSIFQQDDVDAESVRVPDALLRLHLKRSYGVDNPLQLI